MLQLAGWDVAHGRVLPVTNVCGQAAADLGKKRLGKKRLVLLLGSALTAPNKLQELWVVAPCGWKVVVLSAVLSCHGGVRGAGAFTYLFFAQVMLGCD
jgi:hypothetical protein